MKILYLDCFSGISGDMTLSALVDAGADRQYIEDELRKIAVEPFTLEWKRVVKRGIAALKLDVLPDPDAGPRQHRHYSEIIDLIVRAGFSERVVKLSLSIFEKIGIAEAKIHDIPVEKVHFHEVGAIDSIADVVGVALAIDSLGIEKIYSSSVPLGSGTVRCDHGIYPVPAPATLEMMKGLPIAPTPYAMEMTTPTGAGIIAGLVDEFSKGLPPMIVEAIGYGAGTRDLPNQPNVLRAIVGKADPFLFKWQAHHVELPHEHSHSHSHDHHHDHEHHHDHHHHHDHDHEHHEHHHDHLHGHQHAHDNHGSHNGQGHPNDAGHEHYHGHSDRHEQGRRHRDHEHAHEDYAPEDEHEHAHRHEEHDEPLRVQRSSHH